jgi:uncharacterized protein (TIGR03437 family)
VNLADSVYADLFDTAKGEFASSTSSGVTVAVNGVSAPLIYVSPTQINFQVPWETSVTPTTLASVQVGRNGVLSNAQPLTLALAAPSAFVNYSNNAAILVCYGAPVTAGTICTIYGNGFGPKNNPQKDGVPDNDTELLALETPGICQLSIAGIAAAVTYCGAAPGEVIDQMNFVYPAGVPVSTFPTYASLTANGISGGFQIPSPTE